jgi:hypothetical protein
MSPVGWEATLAIGPGARDFISKGLPGSPLLGKIRAGPGLERGRLSLIAPGYPVIAINP